MKLQIRYTTGFLALSILTYLLVEIVFRWEFTQMDLVVVALSSLGVNSALRDKGDNRCPTQ